MTEGLRIVSFNIFPPAYELVAGWAKQRGHRIVLVVTSPSRQGERYKQGHRELVAGLPPTQDVLVTSRMRRTAAPAIAALAADLILSATFPQRIPAEVTTIPRYGALNLHPAPLPRGRGPSPQRLIYEGDLTATGTVHRIAPEFDAGAILGQRTRRLPERVTSDSIMTAWVELLLEALDEAVQRAVAGDPGEEQDHTRATYAAPFSEDERCLCWDEPALTIQRRAAALNLLGPVAQGIVDGQPVSVANVRALCHSVPPVPPVPPGTLLGRGDDTTVVRVADGAVEVTVSS